MLAHSCFDRDWREWDDYFPEAYVGTLWNFKKGRGVLLVDMDNAFTFVEQDVHLRLCPLITSDSPPPTITSPPPEFPTSQRTWLVRCMHNDHDSELVKNNSASRKLYSLTRHWPVWDRMTTVSDWSIPPSCWLAAPRVLPPHLSLPTVLSVQGTDENERTIYTLWSFNGIGGKVENFIKIQSTSISKHLRLSSEVNMVGEKEWTETRSPKLMTVTKSSPLWEKKLDNF